MRDRDAYRARVRAGSVPVLGWKFVLVICVIGSLLLLGLAFLANLTR